MNQLGINLWNWAPRLSEAEEDLPEKIAGMGFTAIELPMTEPVIGEELKRAVLESELSCSLCAALSEGRDLSSFDPLVRASTMQYLKTCLDTGAALHATVLAGPLYAGGGKRHVLSEEDKKREWELAVNGLRELSAYAAQYHIRLAIEPLSRYRTSVINTVEQAISLIGDIDESNVGIHYDSFHACLEEADLLNSLELALQSEKLFHIHACANNRGAPGDGILPWDAFFAKIRAHGYEGHITMETFAEGGLDASFVNVHGTPDEIAERGIRFLKRMLG